MFQHKFPKQHLFLYLISTISSRLIFTSNTQGRTVKFLVNLSIKKILQEYAWLVENLNKYYIFYLLFKTSLKQVGSDLVTFCL